MAFVMGMAGGSASGKSRLLNELKQHLGNKVSVLSLDDYYKPIEEQKKDENGIINFDLPDSINRQQFSHDMEILLNGQGLEIPEYTFNNPEKTEGRLKTIEASKIIILEGLFVFHFEEVKQHFDLSIFIEAEEKKRLQRRLERDISQRGIPEEMILYQWNNHVVPTYNAYLVNARNEADIVINNNVSFAKAFDVLTNYLSTKVK